MVAETAALRRDSASFFKVLLIRSQSRTISVRGSAAHLEYSYWTRFFDDVAYHFYYVIHLRNGVPHRNDGPAAESCNGDKQWFFHGKRHRIDGPAIEHSYGGKEWWVHGIRTAVFSLN